MKTSLIKLSFYNSLVEKINWRNTTVFQSCFSFSLLQAWCTFNMELRILTNSKVLISSMTVFFLKFSPKSTKIRHFWFLTQSFFVLHETLHFDKSKGFDFKCDNSFFRSQSQSTQIKQFLSQIFFLNMDLCILTNSRCWFQIRQ